MPLDSYTKLLCHFDGASGGTEATAATGQTVSWFGTAQLSDAVTPPLTNPPDNATALFDGNSDYLTVPDSDDWNFGTGNFTIDFWIRFISYSNHYIITQFTAPSNEWVIDLTGNRIYFWTNNYTNALYSTFAPTNGVWYHLAIVRNGSGGGATDWIFFVNGNGSTPTVDAGTANLTMPDIASTLFIGQRGNNEATFMNGYLDEIRISKGIARWTSNFTPPTSEYSSGYSHKVNGVTPSKVNGTTPSKVNSI